MTNPSITESIGIYGAVSMVIGFVLLIMIITIIFPSVQKLESHIATPGKQLDGIRRVWGSGPVGRMMRATHILMFFMIRHVPVFGRDVAERIGSEPEPVPSGLKWTVIAPVFLFYFFGFSFLLSGLLMGH
ncbi:MAG: hypothetical protein SVX28_01190 [Pseudomonadota bacterium]|nr:hypothetical protein [Pseudomonadota bacterium]